MNEPTHEVKLKTGHIEPALRDDVLRMIDAGVRPREIASMIGYEVESVYDFKSCFKRYFGNMTKKDAPPDVLPDADVGEGLVTSGDFFKLRKDVDDLIKKVDIMHKHNNGCFTVEELRAWIDVFSKMSKPQKTAHYRFKFWERHPAP